MDLEEARVALIMLFIDLVGNEMDSTDPAAARLFKLAATICVIVVLWKRK